MLDLLDGELELRRLAGDVLGGVVVGERRVDGLLLARGDADEALLEARDQAAGADLDELVAALAALEGLAVDRADEVEDHEVAVGGRAVDDLQARHALAHLVDLLVDGLGIGGGLAADDLQAAVRAERRARAHADLEGERQRLALVGQLAEVQVDVGVADGGDAGLVDGLHVPVGQAAADGLVEDRLAADALDDDGRRDLAGAKTGNLHLASELARLRLQRALDLLGGDLDVDAHARLGQLGDGGGDCGGHAPTLSSACVRTRRPPHVVFAAWIVTGPLGHLYAGVADWAGVLVRFVRARGTLGSDQRAWRAAAAAGVRGRHPGWRGRAGGMPLREVTPSPKEPSMPRRLLLVALVVLVARARRRRRPPTPMPPRAPAATGCRARSGSCRAGCPSTRRACTACCDTDRAEVARLAGRPPHARPVRGQARLPQPARARREARRAAAAHGVGGDAAHAAPALARHALPGAPRPPRAVSRLPHAARSRATRGRSSG